MTRLLVCGGRDFAAADLLTRVLDRAHEGWRISALIHGDAPGADTLARLWAESRNVPHLPFPADWREHGRAAGPMRNQRMLDEGRPEIVIGFKGNRGTRDMLWRAQNAGLPVYLIGWAG